MDIERQLEGSLLSPSLKTGVTLATFHCAGYTPSIKALLNISVTVLQIKGQVLFKTFTDIPFLSEMLPRYLVQICGVSGYIRSDVLVVNPVAAC